MIANYHTHTWRCNHARPDERAYCESAMEQGIRILGFSDHSPYPFDNGYCSSYRMECRQCRDYVDTVNHLKTEYAGKGLEIHTGFEAEYYPRYFDRLLCFLKDFEYEYLILGQHFIDDDITGPYSGDPNDDPAFLRAYCRQCKEALYTGKFSCFAHPDIIRFTADDKLYRSECRSMCRTAKECGVPLEINLLGMAQKRFYPRKIFWEEASAVGNPVILGRDAHYAEQFGETEAEQEALKWVRELDLNLISTLDLIHP